jgi:PAS domain S-box-containing protein
MTLRKRTLIIVGLTAASLILILYVTLRTIVLSSFAELEEQHARQNVERALGALSDNLAALDTIVFDWAAWDDTYVFIEDANEDYIQSNLVDETFTGFKLNLMLFVNPSGQTIFGKGFDLYNEEEASVPESLAEHLADDALLLRHPDTESSVVGIVSLPEGPMLVVSRPILTSEEKGPIRGALVMGRYLDSAESEHLAEITRLSLTLHRFDDSQMPLDFQTARSSLSEEAPILVHPLSAESVAGYALLKDIYGEPSLILRVDMPRDIYAQGQASMLYLLFSLSVVGLVFGVVASLLMDRMVLSRLARLSSDVNSIGASADLSTRVLMTGDDELSSLADTINEMLAALEQAQSGLQESERRVRDVTRTTGDWIWEMDTEGRYTYVSPVVEQILGYTPEEVLGRRYEGFLHPGDLGTLETLIQGISRRKEPFVRYVHQSLHKDGHLVILEATGLPLTDAEGNLLGYRGAHRDVTAERRLEERLAAVYALGRELVLSRDMQQITETTVEAARLLFHCQLCELWLVDEEKRVLVCQASKAVEPVEYIPTLPMDGGKGITAAVAQSGEPLYVPDVREEPLYIDTGLRIRSELCVPLRVGERVIGVLNAESEMLDAFTPGDRRLLSSLAVRAALAIENARLYKAVTQQREQLRALAMRLAEAEEAERQRLARELHDQVGQNLTALGINLNILRAQMPEEAMTLLHSRLDDSLRLVEQTTERIRGVMADLRPPVLDDYGLVAALRWYGAQLASRTSIAVTVQGDELIPRLALPVENALFRIAQEALTNVTKHAQATKATVAVEVDDETVRLIIADDGIGFDPASVTGPDGRRGWGLLTMAERAEAVGSRFRIESRPGQGTRVIVEVER